MPKPMNKATILDIASRRIFRVHLYMWSHDKLRKITRRMLKDGLLRIVRREGDMLCYRTKPPTKEIAMGDIQALTPVSSSTIEAMGHNIVAQTMTVRFKNGSTYLYQNVGTALYDSILNASSVGSSFDKLIKKNAAAHPYTKVA